jgi:flagellar motor switch/type III secretory pathway protein FliN
LELDRPVDGTADLRAGGKLLARGELVEVEGRLGLRITELCR